MSVLHNMSHEVDPATRIKEAIGDLSKVEITGPQILVATYIRPEKTKGGIILTANTLREDEYQGKVGLVVKMGPLAFTEGNGYSFGGFSVKEGDWVFYRVFDGFSMSVNGYHMRLLDDIHIKGRVDHPDTVL